MLRSVAGSMQHLRCHVAEWKNVAVARAAEVRRGLGAGEEDIFRAGGFRETPSGRDVIGVNVRVDDIEDAHPSVFGGLKIGRDLADRVDDGRRGLAAAAEKVGNAHRIRVQELPENHERLHRWLGPEAAARKVSALKALDKPRN